MINVHSRMEIKEIIGGSVASPKGFKATGLHCGIRKKKKDLGILFTETPAISVGVYTTNEFQAAPIQVTKESLATSKTQHAIIVNSGNANAFTGKNGLEDAYTIRNAVSKHFNLSPNEVLVASTGVIGEKLPMEKILNGISELPIQIDSLNGGEYFGEAIMTTDTVIKSLAVEVEIEGKKVIIGGTAKGSGMIEPNMATMLAFISTDVTIEHNTLQQLLREITDRTFNMITVDGDTSTNDMVLVMANGLAGTTTIDESHLEWPVFYYGFNYVAEQLAKLIAKDGEGATKLVTVIVEGAAEKDMAIAIAKKIVGSNLVKTAIFGADGNWGRIVMAIGNSGYKVDEQKLDIAIGEVMVVQEGEPAIYVEEMVKKVLNEQEVKIRVNLHLGDWSATAWGCDLSYDYVRINSAYRT